MQTKLKKIGGSYYVLMPMREIKRLKLKDKKTVDIFFQEQPIDEDYLADRIVNKIKESDKLRSLNPIFKTKN